MPKKLGLRFSENMYGSCEVVDGPESGQERRFVFHYDVETEDWPKTWRDGRAGATGWVDVEGLADRAPLEGFIVMKPIFERFIRYEFDFVGNDGRSYHYAGQKSINHLRPASTWTTLPGAIFDADEKQWARGVARFDFKETLSFALSFRPFLVEV